MVATLNPSDRLLERRATDALMNPSPDAPRLEAAYSGINQSHKSGSSREASYPDHEN